MFIYARLQIKLCVFVFRKQTTMAPFWKGEAMRCCAMGNVDRTFCPKLLSTKQTFDLFFFPFLWHKIIVLISNMFIYVKIGNSKFIEMHRRLPDIYPSTLVFYTRHRVNIMIYGTVCIHFVHYRHVFTNVNIYPIKK